MLIPCPYPLPTVNSRSPTSDNMTGFLFSSYPVAMVLIWGALSARARVSKKEVGGVRRYDRARWLALPRIRPAAGV